LTVFILLAAKTNLRLVNGRRAREGRVEVFHNGTWGTVCDDGWDIQNARVVCRQRHFPGAAFAPHLAYFGEGSGKIWLDEVQCVGNERAIEDCQHGEWGFHNCEHSEDASVICLSKYGYKVPDDESFNESFF